ncbi:MAG: hypothetical protein VKK62_01835 [Synechococcaceae cyanobacterium]|nr:hypothetical protein [Synechococcaceae cyanobacterium]
MSSAEVQALVVDAPVTFGWFAEVAHSDRPVALLDRRLRFACWHRIWCWWSG